MAFLILAASLFAENATSEYEVIFFANAKNCAPCEAMKSTEIPRLEKRLRVWRIINGKPEYVKLWNVKRVPTTILVRRVNKKQTKSTELKRWVGFVSADTVFPVRK